MAAKELDKVLADLKKKGYGDRELRSFAAAERSWAKKGSPEWDFWDKVAKGNS